MARSETAALRDFRFTSRRVRISLAEGTHTACQWRALPSRSLQCTSKLRSRDCSRRTNETSPSKTISASSRRRCRAVGRRASGAGAGLSDAAHHLGGSICRGRLLRRDRAGHHAAVERNPGPAGDRGKRRRGRRHRRCEPRGARHAGRLFGAARHGRDARLQSGALQEAALQPGRRLRSGSSPNSRSC